MIIKWCWAWQWQCRDKIEMFPNLPQCLCLSVAIQIKPTDNLQSRVKRQVKGPQRAIESCWASFDFFWVNGDFHSGTAGSSLNHFCHSLPSGFPSRSVMVCLFSRSNLYLFFERRKWRFARMTEKILITIRTVAMIIRVVILMIIMTKMTTYITNIKSLG